MPTPPIDLEKFEVFEEPTANELLMKRIEQEKIQFAITILQSIWFQTHEIKEKIKQLELQLKQL